MSNFKHERPFGSLFPAMTAVISPAHETITGRALYGPTVPSPMRSRRPGLIAWLGRWAKRRAQRKRLELLDDRLLEDIGTTRREVAAKRKGALRRDR